MKLWVLLIFVGARSVQSHAADPETAQPLTAAQAKALALKVHAETAAMDLLPRFSYRIKSGNGDIDTMRERDQCSIEGLKEALDGDVVEKDWLEWRVNFAWTQKHAIWSEWEHEGASFGVNSKKSRQDRVWTKDLAFERGATAGKPARFVYTSTANQLWEMRLCELAYFRVTPHKFWWATSNHHIDMISFIPPEEADYRFVAAERFDDELCNVVESRGRAERLWISRESGHLRGVLISFYRGGEPKEPVHQNEHVRKIAGRSFATREEFVAWHSGNSIPARQKTEITCYLNEIYFDFFGPNELIRFRDYREVAAGVWIPSREDRAFTHRVEGDSKKHKYIRLWVRVEDVQTDIDLAEIAQSLQPKEGEPIQDQRFGVVVNYKFERDRTRADLLELIDAERQKQAANTELVNRMIAPIEELVGKSAPELPAAGWIGGPPPKLTETPYLVHFWATWCGPCKNDLPLLKELAAGGLCIVGMHPVGTSVEDVDKLIDDRELGYPTYLASPELDGDDRKIPVILSRCFPIASLWIAPATLPVTVDSIQR